MGDLFHVPHAMHNYTEPKIAQLLIKAQLENVKVALNVHI